ncbi:hypothetical protein GCM10011282_27420 [Undibacterium macrobrachii]|uniref:Uncharacterized protein n=1 Tax=Undibacterium macrobrachii TaxID=1119058 RepID=A0ABQ2XIT7_9BURK|nr:hypothetical protein GCM10011282_27420 [Undibacterium macrobrachii]
MGVATGMAIEKGIKWAYECNKSSRIQRSLFSGELFTYGVQKRRDFVHTFASSSTVLHCQ